jgi:hypothetical protein
MYKTNNSFCPIQAGGISGVNNMQRKPIVENYLKKYECDFNISVNGASVPICVDDAESVEIYNKYRDSHKIRYEDGYFMCSNSATINCDFIQTNGQQHTAHEKGEKQGEHIYRGNGGRYNIRLKGGGWGKSYVNIK